MFNKERKHQIIKELKKYPRDLGALYKNGKLGKLEMDKNELKYWEEQRLIKIIDLKNKRVLLSDYHG
jgi:hypothetical protein